MKYSGLSKIFLVVTYYWGNGTDGEIENNLFQLSAFFVGYIVLTRVHIFCQKKQFIISCIRLPYGEHSTRSYKILSRAQKICRFIHEIFGRAHSTLSCHTVFELFTGWVWFTQNSQYNIVVILYILYVHPPNKFKIYNMTVTRARTLADSENGLWSCNPSLDFRKKIVLIKRRDRVIKLIYLFTC